MNCDDMLKMINRYVDGEIDPSMCANLERHLAECNPCRVVVDTLRKTVQFYKGDQMTELPIQFKKKLDDALRQKWDQTMGKG
ncbi:MAG: zf-HC2 domain-containing protein [Phycisphaeraceae bacterium]|nr:zf-HC2 domain-containing protein [Phycisphaeraceae bacterium]